jgi:hypothetical protein
MRLGGSDFGDSDQGLGVGQTWGGVPFGDKVVAPSQFLEASHGVRIRLSDAEGVNSLAKVFIVSLPH